MKQKISKRIFALICIVVFPCSLWGQGSPMWINENYREAEYSNDIYFTGFSVVTVSQGENLQAATNRSIQSAKGDLSSKIRVMVTTQKTSVTQSIRDSNIGEQVKSKFDSYTQTLSNTEIVGIQTASYYSKTENAVYAFAYANKQELAKYYKNQILLNVQKSESLLKTAKDLENQRAKAKARTHCEDAIALFAKTEYFQDLLTAVDSNADESSLQQTKSEALRDETVQLFVKLEQSVYLYITSNENIFGKSGSIISNKLKAMLAKNGCSFTADYTQADFNLTINATTRKIGNEYDRIVFCYADVEIDLFNNFTNKSVYSDEFSQKGGSTTFDRAGREAFEEAASGIAEKIMNWIKN